MIEARIQGIPCQVNVTYFYSKSGTYSRQAETPDEYYGYSEIEFDVYDRKGCKAAWLERKMTAEDKAYIEEKVLEAHND